jgi:glycosyltransferase involved in cell wall biosynthesis
MKFSFLITFYNQEEFVDNCFETIKKIKIPTDFEMIVGDDGSIDKTREKLEYWKSHFGEDKFKIITGNRNDGVINITVRVSNLRKKLLKESSGDYILHLDGDDFYCDYDFIVDTINLVEKHPNISVILFKY